MSRQQLYIAIGGLVFFAIVAFGAIGGGVTALVLLSRRQAAAPVAAVGEAREADAEKLGKPVDEWGYQDIQDHLASKGMVTTRAKGSRGGMWFEPGQAPPFSEWQIKMIEDGTFHDTFLVKDCGSPAAANSNASKIKDIEQKEAFAWRRFTFQGERAILADVRRLLP